MYVEEVVKATRGTLVSGFGDTVLNGVSTDTRELEPGSLFIALEGENFDGHSFLFEALEKGAIAVLGKKEKLDSTEIPGKVAVIGVEDSLRALGDIASFWRHKHSVEIVALTGSNGKTSTKEMISRLLGRKYKTLKNVLNLNNLVGVPLTLLQLEKDHRVGVVEMGMNHPGEIARLVEIADPGYGLITNIQPAHLEGLGSVKGVQAAKGELFEGIKDDGVLFVNYDDPLVRELSERFDKEKISFGMSPEVAVRLRKIVSEDAGGSRFIVEFPDAEEEFFLPVLGRHHVSNALAACAVAWRLGVPVEEIKSGLAAHRPVRQRMEVKEVLDGVHLLDDAYNANPASVSAALETLSRMRGDKRAFAVLGAMLELGKDTVKYHRMIGEKVARLGFDGLLSLGDLGEEFIEGARSAGMPEECLFLARSHGELAEKLAGWVEPGDWVLVKGSRGSRMELVIEKLDRVER